MKIIHCADLHLDSKMNTHLDKESAKKRKSEILHTFERMVKYADDEGITAILIAGDMFDTRNVSATTRNVVKDAIIAHPDITFYYLKGNHDNDNFLSSLENVPDNHKLNGDTQEIYEEVYGVPDNHKFSGDTQEIYEEVYGVPDNLKFSGDTQEIYEEVYGVPDNLKLFGDTWKTYEEADGKIMISGLELTQENSGTLGTSLVLDRNHINIVMLHGQESKSASKDKAEVINLNALKNLGIDYLALGHVHAYKREALDSRGIYCYPGCLEGRGFDECGMHGFVVLDIDENTGRVHDEFIPFAERTLYTIDVDVTGCMTTSEILTRVKMQIEQSECMETDMVKIVLTGEVDVECEKNTTHMSEMFKDKFYFVKISDETVLKVNPADFAYDESLKGEFVRQVLGDDTLVEEDKNIIIRYGLLALAGEEVQ